MATLQRLALVASFALATSLPAAGQPVGAFSDGSVLSASALNAYMGTERPPHKTVFLGGLGPNLAYMQDASKMALLTANGRIGLYQHPNGTSLLGPAGRTAMWTTWGPTGVNPDGSGQTVGEVGADVPVAASYKAWFGGTYPPQVNMNAITGSGNGSGTYTAVSGDASPGTVYTGYFTAADLVSIKSSIDAAIVAGARNVAPFFTPNGGGEDLVDPFATSAYWANYRLAALYGGGIALDVPSNYWRQRGAAYQAMVVQMVKWANGVGIRSSFTVSPYATSADASGNVGACGFDPTFADATREIVAALRAAQTLPTQWVVETYGPAGANCGTENGIGTGNEPGTLNEVALYLANTAGVSPSGTTAPQALGGLAERGQMALTTSRPVASAAFGSTIRTTLRLSDIMGAGTMAAQDAKAVTITGGRILGDTYIQTTATPLFVNGAIIQGSGGAALLTPDATNTLHLVKVGGAAFALKMEGNLSAANVVTTGTVQATGNVVAGPNSNFVAYNPSGTLGAAWGSNAAGDFVIGTQTANGGNLTGARNGTFTGTVSGAAATITGAATVGSLTTTGAVSVDSLTSRLGASAYTYQVTGNLNGTLPLYAATGGLMGWNLSAGGGEVNFVNNWSGGTNRGFDWRSKDSAILATLAPSGVFNPVGGVATATATGLSCAGTTLATATVLGGQFNVVSTCASGAGVTMRNLVGFEQVVWNQGAAAMLLYPPTATMTLGSGAAGAAVSVAVGARYRAVCVSATACLQSGT